ncbi:hypothetical protein Phi12:1_gp56 [Cellulophaga phage phi12:1]|uniref:Uncharacterized protein n=2 Tax=Cellulophaga phage phi12:1 TaxID=1327976 RepID=S0A0J2_9CAUD|nr:hypothetical protein Phi12:1_gp56 [Cellulophaga phage phi12:1]AGO48022.1 hypothetical protein Phi12:1_gp56 [Cellulophaga phage phi12:1]AGO48187.1 hypothetical protein Phi12:3_gp56 [Cellulophaga phage phi12:3]
MSQKKRLSYDQLLTICLGEIGMSSKDFFTMSPAETYFKIKGFDNSKWEKWEQTRLIAYNVYCSMPRKKGSIPKSIENFLPLPSDKARKAIKTVSQMDSNWAKLKNR